MKTEEEIKTELISWLLSLTKSALILGSEIRVLDGRNRADLVAIGNNKIAIFEIKGPRDDLRKLEKQIPAFYRMSHEFYLAAYPEDLKKLKNTIQRSIGLIDVSGTVPNLIRNASSKKGLSKHSAVKWLHLSDIRQKLPFRTTKDKDKMALEMEICQRYDQSELNQFAIESLTKRLVNRHENFLKELGLEVTSDDLKNLLIDSGSVAS